MQILEELQNKMRKITIKELNKYFEREQNNPPKREEFDKLLDILEEEADIVKYPTYIQINNAI